MSWHAIASALALTRQQRLSGGTSGPAPRAGPIGTPGGFLAGTRPNFGTVAESQLRPWPLLSSETLGAGRVIPGQRSGEEANKL